jgi:chorismate-pyruvate lyase
MPNQPANIDERLYPLTDLCSRSGRVLPEAVPVDPNSIPGAYRRLLVHDRDMTPTLEAHYGDRIHIEVLHMMREKQIYWREVVLRLDGSDRPVQYGASRTCLDRFPADAAAWVLQGRTPLGTIMKMWEIAHVCRPYRFLKVTPTAELAVLFGMPTPSPLYGRQNRITNPAGEWLIDVIEVVSP